jgi:hypothetical protein
MHKQTLWGLTFDIKDPLVIFRIGELITKVGVDKFLVPGLLSRCAYRKKKFRYLEIKDVHTGYLRSCCLTRL